MDFVINRNDPFYQIKEQEKRCALGMHNYDNYKNEEKEILICKVCKHMQLPSDIIIEYVDDYIPSKDIENNKGHQTRDGTINFDKTW